VSPSAKINIFTKAMEENDNANEPKETFKENLNRLSFEHGIEPDPSDGKETKSGKLRNERLAKLKKSSEIKSPSLKMSR
jgi:hypothetical protein